MNYRDLSNSLKRIKSQVEVLLAEKEEIWIEMKKETVSKFHKEPALHVSRVLVKALDEAINLAEVAHLSWQD